ncbi:MAG: GDSL-type esterase/lipase family protein [Acidobacteriaceae bacterium]
MLTTPSLPANSFGSANSFGAKDYTYQWPGSYFRAAFQGTRVYFRIVKGDEILHIVVDGQPTAPLVKPEPGPYEVEGLSHGKHTIGIFVATETQAAPNTFGGIAIPSGEKPITLPQRRRQIEFIGDSHTVGYGDLSPTRACTHDQVWADTDDTKAFGPMTARHYHADYQINAISGRGVVRDYGGGAADTLPQVYPYVLFAKQQKYSDLAWKPQVLVIALGTNDFSTPLHSGERWKTRAQLHQDYEATYLRFLQQLRARNPHADIIVWATNIGGGEVESESQKVVRQLQQQGDQRITFLPINGLSFGACNSHPTLADEKVIADKLQQRIDADPRLWQSR